jgi:hypothetical protein
MNGTGERGISNFRFQRGAHSFLIKPVADADIRNMIEAFAGY